MMASSNFFPYSGSNVFKSKRLRLNAGGNPEKTAGRRLLGEQYETCQNVRQYQNGGANKHLFGRNVR